MKSAEENTNPLPLPYMRESTIFSIDFISFPNRIISEKHTAFSEKKQIKMLLKYNLAKEVGVRIETIENYLSILEQSVQVKTLSPYFENIRKHANSVQYKVLLMFILEYF